LVNEGAEFYARGLTSLRTALLGGLETGQLVYDSPQFKKKNGSLLPAFLYGAWVAIFDDSGVLRSNINADAVSCLNQLLAVYGKIEGGHTPQSEKDVVIKFCETEQELRLWDQRFEFLAQMEIKEKRESSNFDGLPCPLDRYLYRLKKDNTYYQDFILPEGIIPGRAMLSDQWTLMVLLEARRLLRRVLVGEDPRELTPAHGSGVSACGTPVFERYGKPRYIKAIDDIWSYSDYFVSGTSQLADVMPGRMESPGVPARHVWLDDLEEYTPCAKVLLVPKDARGPRMISCEPRECMWIQQGTMRKLVTCAEAHTLTRGLVNFTNQVINRQLAYVGSINQQTASLDLSDASDRITVSLIKFIWPKNWVDALMACRSGSTELPDGTVLELTKSAPMGSANCFPVMALTIWALLTAAANPCEVSKALRTAGNCQRTGRTFRWSSPVRVYGDDIIVDSVFAEHAMLVLESVGLKVNRNKSFVRGSFRESCGGEFLNGRDITPVRLRTLPTDDVPARMKLIAFHNLLYRKGLFQPYWLTDMIHEWYSEVPEQTGPGYARALEKQAKLGWFESLESMHVPWTLIDEFINVGHVGTIAGVLDVHYPDNLRLRRRYRKALCRPEYRFLSVVPMGVKYPTDRWSQVFRALVNPRRELELGWDALAKRVSYKYRWAALL